MRRVDVGSGGLIVDDDVNGCVGRSEAEAGSCDDDDGGGGKGEMWIESLPSGAGSEVVFEVDEVCKKQRALAFG